MLSEKDYLERKKLISDALLSCGDKYEKYRHLSDEQISEMYEKEKRDKQPNVQREPRTSRKIVDDFKFILDRAYGDMDVNLPFLRSKYVNVFNASDIRDLIVKCDERLKNVTEEKERKRIEDLHHDMNSILKFIEEDGERYWGDWDNKSKQNIIDFVCTLHKRRHRFSL